MDFLKLFDRDFRVYGRGVQLLMPKQLLDKPDIGPMVEHVRGARMAQEVATPPVGHVGLFHPFADHPTNDVGIEGLAVGGQE
jgi:hypothetical protein